MIVNSGLDLIRDLLGDPAKVSPSHFAVGTGTTAVVAGDTTLETEVDRETITTRTISGIGIVEYVGELASTDANGNSLSEVGVLNASSLGDLLIRETHTPFSKTVNFGVKYIIRHTITNV